MVNKRIVIASSLALSAVVVLYLGIMTEPAYLHERLRSVDPAPLIAGFAVFLVNYMLRAWRLKVLFGDQNIPAVRFLGITQIFGALNYLLPARLGDISFPFLVKRLARTSYSVSTASLIAARALDLVSMVLLLPFALALSIETLPENALESSLLLVALVCVAAILGSLLLYRYGTSPAATTVTSTTVAARLKQFAKNTVVHLRGTLSPALLLKLVPLSVGIWLCIVLNFYVIVHAVGIDITLFTVVAITLVMIPLSLLPVQGFANLGTHELAWVAVLTAFGFPFEQANQTAVLTHLILAVFVILVGCVGLVLIALTKTTELYE